jgi:hypothetical protein
MTEDRFERDDYPGRPRILFIGLANSSHTHSWIDLLKGSQLNLRLFSASEYLPPPDWDVRTYVTANSGRSLDLTKRKSLFGSGNVARFGHRLVARARGREWNPQWLKNDWLVKIIQDWRPDVIHTLGLEPASYLFSGVSERLGSGHFGKWVVQVRGGPDLALHRWLPEYETLIREVLAGCDQLIADNPQNYQHALEMGLKESQIAPLGVVPGTGGIDIEGMSASWPGGPSQRRSILWPKAYECPQSKALPVLEALSLVWERLRPFEIHMLAADPEVRMWFQTLHSGLRECCILSDRLPRAETLKLMSNARVLLAPSLSDGVPNSLYEAMAAGAFPIVSPLETIRSVVEDEQNVLFARNLYPDEIASALVRAFTDDSFVDEAAKRNLELVRRIANRDEVRARVVKFYHSLASGQRLDGLKEREC